MIIPPALKPHGGGLFTLSTIWFSFTARKRCLIIKAP